MQHWQFGNAHCPHLAAAFFSTRLGMPSRSPLPSLWCLDNLYLILVTFWSTLVQCQGSLWWSPYPQRFGLANLIAYKFPVTQFNCRATRGDTVLLLLTTFVMFWDKLSLAGLVHHSMIPFTTNRDNHRLTPHLLDHHLFINPTVWLFNCTIESTTTVPLCGLADHSLNYNWLQLHPRVAR